VTPLEARPRAANALGDELPDLHHIGVVIEHRVTEEACMDRERIDCRPVMPPRAFSPAG
jgi:hypothetical protein